MPAIAFAFKQLSDKVSGRSNIKRIKAQRDHYAKKSRMLDDRVREIDHFTSHVIIPNLRETTENVNELIDAVETWASMGGAEDPDAMTEAWDRVTSAIAQLKERDDE